MRARVRARLFDSGRILDEQATEAGGWLIDVEMPRGRFDRLARQEGRQGEEETLLAATRMVEELCPHLAFHVSATKILEDNVLKNFGSAEQ